MDKEKEKNTKKKIVETAKFLMTLRDMNYLDIEGKRIPFWISSSVMYDARLLNNI